MNILWKCKIIQNIIYLNINTMTHFRQILCLTALLFTLHANFSVYMPQCAVSKFPDQYINYTLANFGHIPYGSSLIGQLIIPSDEDFCSENQNETFITTNDNIKQFLLIKRGECKFTKKIINAQKKKIDFAIVYDNVETNSPSLVMANDGFGHLVDIPAIFISNKDGKALASAFKQCGSVILNMKFDVFTSKIVNLTLWLDSNNRESFITVKDFYNQYFSSIKKKINLSVNFKTSLQCKRNVCEEKDCLLGSEKYCLHTDRMIGDKPVSGASLIKQNLRSYYLLDYLNSGKKDIETWWKYMSNFDNDDCLEKLDLQACSKKAFLKAFPGRLDQTMSTVYDEINGKAQQAIMNAQNDQDNPLREFATAALNNDIIFYPEATINGRNYYGLFKAGDIFNMICQSLEDPPAQCHSFSNKQGISIQQDQTGDIWKTILMIIVMMLLFFLVAIFIYTRLIRKQINQKMNTEVNKMVEHYVSMTEQKSRSNVGL